MTDPIDRLRQEMDAAVAAMDFEAAASLRDRIALLRGGATEAEALSADTSGLSRQKPGAMGLGTSRQRVDPPAGWKPPKKPDPMVTRKR